MRNAVNFVLFLAVLQLSACASGPALPYPDNMNRQSVTLQMQQLKTRAMQNDKLAMYVLGANWCHDSVDFVAMLKDPETAAVLEKDYEVQFINVGYLENIREYVTQYNVPVIYGTPTVLIVDPRNDVLLNRDSVSLWRNASNRNTREAREYLTRYSAQPRMPNAQTSSPALDTALRSIDAFEQRQAERIYAAYDVVGPLMAARDAGESAPDFNSKWGNLAAMRSAITKDLANLRQSAREQDADGVSDIRLTFPEYTLFND